MTIALAKNRDMLAGGLPVRFESLTLHPFVDLLALGDDELLRCGARRFIVPENPGIGYPCRVSLAFARAGEAVLLVNHRHLDQPTTPYRAEGPVFVRESASAYARNEEYPEIIMQREMAVRAYDAAGMMVEAELAGKDDLIDLTERWLTRADVAHVDYHSARRGCFFCRVRRA